MINDGELGYYVSAPEIDLEKISWKGEGNDKAKIHLEKAVELLQTISEADFNFKENTNYDKGYDWAKKNEIEDMDRCSDKNGDFFDGCSEAVIDNTIDNGTCEDWEIGETDYTGEKLPDCIDEVPDEPEQPYLLYR
jgi:hypothetical protein